MNPLFAVVSLPALPHAGSGELRWRRTGWSWTLAKKGRRRMTKVTPSKETGRPTARVVADGKPNPKAYTARLRTFNQDSKGMVVQIQSSGGDCELTGKQRAAVCTSLLLAFSTFGVGTPRAYAQLGRAKELAIKTAVCGGGAFGGYKLGAKVAELEAKKLKLAGPEAEKHRRAIQIGMAMALCGGGVLIANTTFSKLSERDRKARERELEAAVQEAAPRSYALPDHPGMNGSATPQPIVTEGNQECRFIEDVLTDGAQSDRALVKFCRSTGGGNWKVQKY